MKWKRFVRGTTTTLSQLRLLDYVAFVLAVGIIALFSVIAASGGEGEQVAIESDEGDFVYPLNTDREFTLRGPIGTTDVQIKDGRVRVVEDPGPQQICVRQGWIERSGEWLACLPSHVFIQIEGGQENNEIDAQTF
ncbi:MAG: NusG domain II-containing protein [Spirochaetales bacterium]